MDAVYNDILKNNTEIKKYTHVCLLEKMVMVYSVIYGTLCQKKGIYFFRKDNWVKKHQSS